MQSPCQDPVATKAVADWGIAAGVRSRLVLRRARCLNFERLSIAVGIRQQMIVAIN